jgi:hypothetical protein
LRYKIKERTKDTIRRKQTSIYYHIASVGEETPVILVNSKCKQEMSEYDARIIMALRAKDIVIHLFTTD